MKPLIIGHAGCNTRTDGTIALNCDSGGVFEIIQHPSYDPDKSYSQIRPEDGKEGTWEGDWGLLEKRYVYTDLQLIARACNAHADLLAACQAALQVIDKHIPVDMQVCVPGIARQLRAAIDQATR